METTPHSVPNIEDLKFLENNRGFLGREFLTWLWFKSETQSHKITIPSLGEFHFFVDDLLNLSGASCAVRENNLKGGTPAYAQEARSALMSGKMVQQAKFVLQEQDKTWSFVISAEDLSLKNVRLPSNDAEDAETHLSKRLMYMHTLTDIVDALYREYFAIRLSADFEKEVHMIQDWLEAKN